ncbi:hypothetical protein ACH3XW_43575 [Acanthocheilonema viteae]
MFQFYSKVDAKTVKFISFNANKLNDKFHEEKKWQAILRQRWNNSDCNHIFRSKAKFIIIPETMENSDSKVQDL